MKRFLLILLLLAGAFSGKSQTIDSIARLDTNTSPGHIYVRLKFPHQGFIYKGMGIQCLTIYPTDCTISFGFQECTPSGGTYYFEDTLDIDIDRVIAPPYTTLHFLLVLVSNTTDTNCVHRSTRSITDSATRAFPPYPVAVRTVEEIPLLLYPNPITGSQIHLDFKNAIHKPEQIHLYSLEGRKIETQYDSGNTLIRLPENLASGTYFLLLTFPDGQQLRRKITVQ